MGSCPIIFHFITGSLIGNALISQSEYCTTIYSTPNTVVVCNSFQGISPTCIMHPNESVWSHRSSYNFKSVGFIGYLLGGCGIDIQNSTHVSSSQSANQTQSRSSAKYLYPLLVVTITSSSSNGSVSLTGVHTGSSSWMCGSKSRSVSQATWFILFQVSSMWTWNALSDSFSTIW